MSEYIGREAILAKCAYEQPWGADAVIAMIEDFPAADVRLVRHGRWGHRWICSNMTGYEYACSCSECGKPTYRISTLEPMPPYCPNCGADMSGLQNVNNSEDEEEQT